MGKRSDNPSGEHGRPGAHRADGWTNPRDREDDGPTHDDTRLTHEEHYGTGVSGPWPSKSE